MTATGSARTIGARPTKEVALAPLEPQRTTPIPRRCARRRRDGSSPLGRLLAALALVAGCRPGPPAPEGGDDAGAAVDQRRYDGAPAGSLEGPCADEVAAVYAAAPSPSPLGPGARGAMVACAPDRVLGDGELNTLLVAGGYRGPRLPSGAMVHRIAYRTTRARRGDGLLPEDVATGLLLLPTRPARFPGPLVVAAHGSVGLAPSCAPTRGLRWEAAAVSSFQLMALGPVGLGLPVVAPDYAGFRPGTVPGWSVAEDEAHSVLDATRAADQALGQGTLDGRVVLIGHSQGGHAVLSANALAGEYGMAGRIAATVALAPGWVAARTYGAALAPLAAYTTAANSTELVYSLTYFYGHGELLDGPGAGAKIFLEARRAQAAAAFGDNCLGAAERAMRGLGVRTTDFLAPAFLEEVATDCALIGQCATPAARVWQSRFRADRPAVDGAGGPIVIWQGGRDTTVRPDRAACGFERIRADLRAAGGRVTLRVCGDGAANHSSIVPLGLAWVNQWLAGGGPGVDEPPPCGDERSLDPPGETLACNRLPPNVD